MSGGFFAEHARQSCEGQNAASRALQDIGKGMPSPDLLHERLQAVLVTGEPERLRSFMRVIQKRLEASR